MNAQSKYSVGRYDTFAVDKKLMLIFSVGDLFLGLSAVFLAEIIQVSDIDYNASSKNIIGSVMIRDEKVPVFDILGYFGIDSKGAVAINKGEGDSRVLEDDETIGNERGSGVLGAVAINKAEGVGGVLGVDETIWNERGIEVQEFGGTTGSISLNGSIKPEVLSWTSAVSMIILKRGLGDSSQLQRIGIVVDHIEGVLDEGALDRFPFPEIALNKSNRAYQGLMMYSDNLVLLLNIPWLMEMILPSG